MSPKIFCTGVSYDARAEKMCWGLGFGVGLWSGLKRGETDSSTEPVFRAFNSNDHPPTQSISAQNAIIPHD